MKHYLYKCSNCKSIKFIEEEILCWKCGTGKMYYVGNIGSIEYYLRKFGFNFLYDKRCEHCNKYNYKWKGKDKWCDISSCDETKAQNYIHTCQYYKRRLRWKFWLPK